MIFFRISRQIPENSDVCRFFNQLCENRSDICRKLIKILNFVKIIHYFSKLFIGVLNHHIPSRSYLALHCSLSVPYALFLPFLPSFACKRQQKSLLAQRTRIIFLLCAGTTQMDCPASLSFLWWSLSCWLAIGSPLTRARSLCVYLPARACLALPCRTSPSPRGHTASVSITCRVVRLFWTVYRPNRENW